MSASEQHFAIDRRPSRRARWRAVWVPVVVLAILATGIRGVGVWHQSQAEDLARAEAEFLADHVQLQLADWWRTRLLLVEFLSERFVDQYQHDESAFRRDSRRLQELYPGFQALNWIDVSGTLTWVVPVEANLQAVGKNLFEHPEPSVRAAIGRAKRESSVARTPAFIELLQGGRGFATYHPIHDNAGALLGYLNAVFRVQQALEHALLRTGPSALFHCRVTELDGLSIFESEFASVPDTAIPSIDSSHTVHRSLDVAESPWVLALTPTDKYLDRLTGGNRAFLEIAAFLVALCLAGLVRSLLRRRVQLLEIFEVERMVATISTRFVRLRGDEVVDALPAALQAVCGWFQVDAGVVLARGDRPTRWHHVCESLRAAPSLESTMAAREFPGFGPLLDRNNPVILTRDDDSLPSSERAILDRAEAQALVFVPLLGVEGVTGALGVFLREKQRWSDHETRLLQLAAQPFASAAIRSGIEERQRVLTDQLHQSQKMEALGQLAGGVAHDFNNLLTVIVGNTALVRDDADDREAWVGECLDEVELAGQRASALTQQLLTFGRRQPPRVERIDPREVLGQTESLLRRLITAEIDFFAHVPDSLSTIEVDPALFEQVVMNLVINAADAMPDGGRLRLMASEREVDASFAEANPGVRTGRHLVIEVGDEGVGIPPEVLGRIFEPFFTTKGLGSGTGLGLSTVYRAIEQSRGAIEVESTVGEGTVFRVFVPCCTTAAPERDRPVWEASPGGSETVLVCEDDPMVQNLTRKALEVHGYQVITANDGQDGLERARQRGGAIDLLVTDVVMPRLNGPQLAEQLRELRPDLPVLFVSGYAADAFDHVPDGLDSCEFLAKPYDAKALVARVHSLLVASRDASGEPVSEL
ncbi:MAG: ATP-binding protein [Planctomycetota bacterium]